MRVEGLIFGCCLCLVLVLILAFSIDERPFVEHVDLDTMVYSKISSGHGVTHPTYKTMQRGGPGLERHEPILLLGWFFGAVVSALFVVCLAFGARRNGEVGPIKVPLTIGGIIYVLIWSATVWSYRGYMNGDMDGRFLALPYPMAWMVYGVWLFPAFFIGLYVYRYEKYFWNEESAAKFQAILDARDRRDGGTV